MRERGGKIDPHYSEKTTLKKSRIIRVKGTITLVGQRGDAAAIKTDRNNKQVTIKNCEPFTDCETETNNTQVDNAKKIVAVMLMYHLIEQSGNYSGTTGSFSKYHKDEQKNPIADSNSFKFKSRFLANTNERGIINAEIAVSLKYLNNFFRTFKIPLINCEISVILTWSGSCIIFEVNRVTNLQQKL